LANPRFVAALHEAERLRLEAAARGTTAAALAISFALRAPRVTTVLLGATSPEQVREYALAIHL
jgi:aryl-alcohol dehydrogenase-like predicted oxidoreductase